MQKLYTKKIDREQLFFVVIIAGLFLLGAAVFHPTLHLFQRPFREQKMDRFLAQMGSTDFNMREFWQFREFYSPGNFSFDLQTVSLAGALQFNTIVSPKSTLLTFSSPQLKSTDSIVDKSSTDYISESITDPRGTILLKQPDRIAFRTTDGKVHLVFLRSSEEMVKTLGLFDYGEKEYKILDNKLWLNETVISP